MNKRHIEGKSTDIKKKKKWCQPEIALWNKQWQYQKACIVSPYIALQCICKGLLNVK